MIKNCVALLVIGFLLASCATEPKKPESLSHGDYTYTKEYISWLSKKEMKKSDVTGLSIALVDNQRVVWAEGFGYSDMEKLISATPETVYRVGSVSKLFTATAVMQLSEQNKLDIDQPLQAYIPDFSIRTKSFDSDTITLRTLMTHHSGLPSDLAKEMWTKNPEPFDMVVPQLREEYVAFPPNMIFSYSNLGVTLLGVAVEKVAGRDFISYMNDFILRPLGMDHSSFATGLDPSPLKAKAYKNGKEVEEIPLRDVPAGGLNSTVVDLSRFMQMVFAGGKSGERQIVQSETLAEMLRPQNADVPLDLNFRTGLAWTLSGLGDIDIKNAGVVAHHSGATLYHRSMLILLPDYKLGVVVLSNSSTSGEVVNKIAAETLRLALETKTGIKQPERKKVEVKETALSQEALQSYEGTYATMMGVIPVRKKSDYLLAKTMGVSLRLVPRVDGMLGIRYKLLGLFPISLGNLDYVGISQGTVAGHDILKASQDGQEILIGERIIPVPISEKWLSRTGDYRIINSDNDTPLIENFHLSYDKGLLIVEYSMPILMKNRLNLALKPISDTEAVIYGLGRGMGETIRVVTVGGQEHLKYSGYLLKKCETN